MIVTQAVSKAMATAVDRHNGKRRQKLELYHKAIETFEATHQWPVGHIETLYTGKLIGQPAQVYLKNEGGWINLYLYVQGETLNENFYSQPFTIGVLEPLRGFQVATGATEEAYLKWNLEVRKEMVK